MFFLKKFPADGAQGRGLRVLIMYPDHRKQEKGSDDMSEFTEQLFIDAVRTRRQAMWRVAYSLLRSEADAEDAVSSAVESVWKHLPRIRTEEALPAYLMRSVINAAHDELRRRKRTVPIEPLENVLEAPEADRGIADYVARMDEKYRLPILLKYDEGMQEKEIAAALRLPRGTVSTEKTS